MPIRVPKLTRTKSGLWTARKVIPPDVRGAFDDKWESKPTWPAGWSHGEAKAAFATWLADIEARIASAQRAASGSTIELSEQQLYGLARVWYEAEIAKHGATPSGWRPWPYGVLTDDPEFAPDDSGRAYADPDGGFGGWRLPALEAATSALIRDQGLALADQQIERLTDIIHRSYADLCREMEKRQAGDFGPDPALAKLPAWEEPTKLKPVPDGGVRLMDLFDGYVAERQPSPATQKAWKRQVRKLSAFLGHDDAARITPEDVIAWKNKLLEPTAEGKRRAANTVRDSYLAAIKTVMGWGVENKKLASNAASGITARGPRKPKLRASDLTEEEAKIILAGTLQEPPEGLTPEHKLARRWVPWLCAYTGARVDEMAQLRAEDVAERGGIWSLRITPEAGGTKNHEARDVPLHPHLIEQGFLAIVVGRKGPLFYDPARHRGGTEGNPQSKKVGERLAKWVRELGVDDPNVRPNHGWRHRFMTASRLVGMPEAHAKAIAGHKQSDEHRDYGQYPLSILKQHMDKIPRIML